MSLYEKHWKRPLDAALSALGLLILSPLLLLVAAWVKIDSPGPVLFRQQRVGRGKAGFDILKFRSMRADAPGDVPTHLLKDPGRLITRSGRFLRKSSLDELPQLINILRGEMALVGPRPALYNQYDLIRERDKYGANGCRPGLTGLAQVSGRDELAIPVKAKLDGDYAKDISLRGDLSILLKTVLSVICSDGIVEGKQG